MKNTLRSAKGLEASCVIGLYMRNKKVLVISMEGPLQTLIFPILSLEREPAAPMRTSYATALDSVL
jgi:hypothetical protein